MRFPDPVIKLFSKLNSVVYRISGGRMGGRYRGAPVLLLTVVGRKSGEPRTTPLVYLLDGDDYIVAASKGGADKDPIWLLNLEAAGQATVAVGDRTLEVTPSRVPPAEKEALWGRFDRMLPSMKDYRGATARDIPLIRLHIRRG